jgi:hypothetical protein
MDRSANGQIVQLGVDPFYASVPFSCAHSISLSLPLTDTLVTLITACCGISTNLNRWGPDYKLAAALSPDLSFLVFTTELGDDKHPGHIFGGKGESITGGPRSSGSINRI